MLYKKTIDLEDADVLIISYEDGVCDFKRILNDYSEKELQKIAETMADRIEDLSKLIVSGLRSRECAETFAKINILKNIRSGIAQHIKKEPVVINI